MTIATGQTALAADIRRGLSALGLLLPANAGELTIAAGVITVTGNYHTIDTEADAASDDLDTISGGADGMPLFLFPANNARTVVVKHGTGNIICPGGVNISLDDATDFLLAFFSSANNKWSVVAGFSLPVLAAATGGHVLRQNAAGSDYEVSNIGVVQQKIKAADQNFNSTTYANDTHLFQEVKAGQQWVFEFQISAIPDATSGVKFAVDVPAGSTFRVWGRGIEGGAAWALGTTTTDAADIFSNANDWRQISIYGVCDVAIDGNIQLQVGTNTGTTAVVVHKYSYMRSVRKS